MAPPGKAPGFTTPPTGAQHLIEADGYRAVVTEVGASLRVLEHEGRPLVLAYDEGVPMPHHQGAVLAPWPNRVADGRYAWDGTTQQLALTEPTAGNAIHGLVAFAAWECVESSVEQVRLRTAVRPQPGYPFRLDVEAAYHLGPGGLTWTVTATHVDGPDAPYGVGVHPYLVAGAGTVDEWTLTLDVGRWLAVDERLIPTGLHPVAGSELAGLTQGPLGDRRVDTAFTDAAQQADGTARAVVRAGDGHGAELTWDARVLPWVQVYSGDATGRRGLAVEPTSCPPDALTSGTDVVRLGSGGSHSARWGIAAVRPPAA